MWVPIQSAVKTTGISGFGVFRKALSGLAHNSLGTSGSDEVLSQILGLVVLKCSCLADSGNSFKPEVQEVSL